MLIVAIIEEARALDEIEAIAATPRLDALFIGTSDLSFSLGFRGRQDEPRLQQAIDRVKDAARRAMARRSDARWPTPRRHGS